MRASFLVIVSLAEHSDGGVNSLIFVNMNDDDKLELPIEGRAGYCKKMKVLKGDERSRATSDDD